jgi:hypothetical protein
VALPKGSHYSEIQAKHCTQIRSKCIHTLDCTYPVLCSPIAHSQYPHLPRGCRRNHANAQSQMFSSTEFWLIMRMFYTGVQHHPTNAQSQMFSSTKLWLIMRMFYTVVLHRPTNAQMLLCINHVHHCSIGQGNHCRRRVAQAPGCVLLYLR